MDQMKASSLGYPVCYADWLKNRFAPLPEMPQSFTRSDVMKAFREGSLVHHPDHGGDPEMFRKLVDAKEMALEVLARFGRAAA